MNQIMILLHIYAKELIIVVVLEHQENNIQEKVILFK